MGSTLARTDRQVAQEKRAAVLPFRCEAPCEQIWEQKCLLQLMVLRPPV